MLVIIPLGGLGTRFAQEGYRLPKPLIRVYGKEMIRYVIDNLNLSSDDQLLIIYKNDLDKHRFREFIEHHYPKTRLCSIDVQTRGAAETLLIGLDQLSDDELTQPVATVDCDTFYTTDILSVYRKRHGNAVFCFEDEQSKPIYSYSAFEGDRKITEIAEKVRISNYANSGCYCFSSASELQTKCREVIKLNRVQKGELYISSVIGLMLEQGEEFEAHLIDKSAIKCLGTPMQLKIFCSHHQHLAEPKRVVFDLDHTLVTHPVIPGDYSSVRPIKNNIELCRSLHREGHTIIIHTARRMRTHGGNIGRTVGDIGEVTIKILRDFEIPYDELHFGKPYADFYIDDKAVYAHSDLEKELGFYKTSVAERNFNRLKTSSVKTVVKTGEAGKLRGEIYWYRHIPTPVVDLFPIMYRANRVEYELEAIEGVTLSRLYVNESLSDELLLRYLETIDSIHRCEMSGEPEFDLYANYVPKIEQRYREYDYSVYPDSKEVYERLRAYFADYRDRDRAVRAPIHGDPVFSNCLVDYYNNFKLIDMRGLQGGVETILGDVWYDYAKIYQSLLGYDEILLDRILDSSYKSRLQRLFEQFILDRFDADRLDEIRMITNSLLFTLIPLHRNEKCHAYYKLIRF